MKSTVSIRATKENVIVNIDEFYGDLIKESVVEKWQKILDLTIKLFNVPSALIMQLHESEIEVFLRSSNAENPYETNEKAPLGMGLYCETVIGTDKMLMVPDSLVDPIWMNNPDVELDMIHYLGLPLKWPNGDAFGTICVLDDHEKLYNSDQLELFEELRNTVEKELLLVEKNFHLNKTIEDLKKTHKLLLEHEKSHLTNKLVSSIAHEISTPIGVALTTTSYLGYIIKSLSDKESKLKLAEGFKLVEKNLEQASTLIKSFKTISVDQGRRQIEKINIATYIKGIILNLKYDLRNKHVEIVTDIPDDLYVITCPGALSQVLINIVVNAAKHAFNGVEEKIVKITVSKFDDEILLSISDNGTGMTEDQTIDAFKSFARFSDDTDGSGMGLTIVKELVENTLNGAIECLSKLDVGTDFNIKIPMEVSRE